MPGRARELGRSPASARLVVRSGVGKLRSSGFVATTSPPAGPGSGILAPRITPNAHDLGRCVRSTPKPSFAATPARLHQWTACRDAAAASLARSRAGRRPAGPGALRTLRRSQSACRRVRARARVRRARSRRCPRSRNDAGAAHGAWVTGRRGSRPLMSPLALLIVFAPARTSRCHAARCSPAVLAVVVGLLVFAALVKATQFLHVLRQVAGRGANRFRFHPGWRRTCPDATGLTVARRRGRSQAAG